MITQTQGGRRVSFDVRGDTNDAAVAIAILGEDEYLLRGHRPMTGWALDIGAHIGTVAIALAMDHPELSVVAVEPVPDNAAIIRRNVERNGLTDRIFVEEAAAGTVGEVTFDYATGGSPDQGYVRDNRYIGNIWRTVVSADGTTISCPTLTIPQLCAKYGVERFTFAKIDCEGCEWTFLAKGAGRLDEIVGEYHDAGPDRIIRLLARTHAVDIVADHGGNGIFRAVRL